MGLQDWDQPLIFLFCKKKKKKSFKEEKNHFGTLVTKSQSSFSKHVLL